MRKIGTCCYCGTRAVLRIDRAQHELACSNCGAPLHHMKLIKQPSLTPIKRTPLEVKIDQRGYRPVKRKRTKRRVEWSFWDMVEDVLDEGMEDLIEEIFD